MKNIVQSKCLPFIAMFYLLVCICIRIFGIYPIIPILNEQVTLSTILFFPVWSVLCDIIAEIYGYKMSKQLIYSAFACLLLFSLCANLSITILDQYSQPKINFGHIFDHKMFEATYSFLVYLIAWRLNIFFLLKWKGILNSKYFILRSIGSSSIGIIISVIFLNLYYQPFETYIHNIHNFIIYTVTGILVRILLTSLLTFPAYLAIAFIRTIDSEYLNSGENVLDNPFLKKENIIAQ